MHPLFPRDIAAPWSAYSPYKTCIIMRLPPEKVVCGWLLLVTEPTSMTILFSNSPNSCDRAGRGELGVNCTIVNLNCQCLT